MVRQDDANTKEENWQISRVNLSSNVSIGGKKVEWRKVSAVLQKMQVQLSASKKIERATRSIRRKGNERELKNLEFIVQYDKSVNGELRGN